MNRCLFCYKELALNEVDFHPACSKKLFGTKEPPELPYSETDISGLALEVIQKSVAVTGAQPKLSMDIGSFNGSRKLTIVGLWGAYILKPPTEKYHHLPENEDLTMHLAELCGISTVPHSLIRMKSGSLAYITKRIDRGTKKVKYHMEDMCQLTERMTEHKYNGSYEQVAKVILKYSNNPGLDVVNFYEIILFSFLVGNGDMHLKNFSLINKPNIGYHLSPAYDLLCTFIATPDDNEELALHLNGKKNKITQDDFIRAMTQANVGEKVIGSIFSNYKKKLIPAMLRFIETGFLPVELSRNYIEVINSGASKLALKLS